MANATRLIAAPNCKRLFDSLASLGQYQTVNKGAHDMETDFGIIIATLVSLAALAIGLRAA